MEKHTESSIEEEAIANDLKAKSSSVRRAAAKKIGKQKLQSLSSQLLTAYIKEREDSRTWQTQAEMIKSLGRVHCIEAIPYLENIVNNNIEFDTITIFATTAYLRMKGADFFETATRLLKSGKHSVQAGVIRTLIFDSVKLSNPQMTELISIVDSIPDTNEVGVENLKERMACLMAGWPRSIAEPQLNRYLQNDSISKTIVGHALRGKAYGPKEY